PCLGVHKAVPSGVIEERHDILQRNFAFSQRGPVRLINVYIESFLLMLDLDLSPNQFGLNVILALSSEAHSANQATGSGGFIFLLRALPHGLGNALDGFVWHLLAHAVIYDDGHPLTLPAWLSDLWSVSGFEDGGGIARGKLGIDFGSHGALQIASNAGLPITS